MAGQLEAWSGVGQLASVPAQYRQVAVDKVADIDVLPVGAESDGFGQCPDIDFAGIDELLASILRAVTAPAEWWKKAVLGMFEPRASTETARSPLGLIARPSGESPTVT